MRWALVILLLYVLPLWILFKNKQDFKRASIYGGMYVIVATVIVVCNIYISTINKMEEALEYRSDAFNEYCENHLKSKAPTESSKKKQENINDNKEKEALNVDEIAKESEENTSNTKTMSTEESDEEIISNFKSEIYKIEKKALVPMRSCIPDTKNLEININSINKAEDDVAYAKKMCDEVVKIYEDMEVPTLSSDEDTNQLEYSKICVQKAYILRSNAMECAQKMLETKNLKYVSEIKEYLSLSDKEIKKFVDTINNL